MPISAVFGRLAGLRIMTRDERNKPDRHLSGSDLDALIRNFFAKDLDEIIRKECAEAAIRIMGMCVIRLSMRYTNALPKIFPGR